MNTQTSQSSKERRRARRVPVRMSAFAYVGSRGYACKIVDVSPYGCRIQHGNPTVFGYEVQLHVVGQTMPRSAWVIWKNAKEIGLSFFKPSADVAEI